MRAKFIDVLDHLAQWLIKRLQRVMYLIERQCRFCWWTIAASDEHRFAEHIFKDKASRIVGRLGRAAVFAQKGDYFFHGRPKVLNLSNFFLFDPLVFSDPKLSYMHSLTCESFSNFWTDRRFINTAQLCAKFI